MNLKLSSFIFFYLILFIRMRNYFKHIFYQLNNFSQNGVFSDFNDKVSKYPF